MNCHMEKSTFKLYILRKSFITLCNFIINPMDLQRLKQDAIRIKDKIKTHPIYKHLSKNFTNYCFVVIPVIVIIYLWLTFPQNLKHIEPQHFDSHQPGDLDPHLRSLRKMRPRVYTDAFVSVCEDLEVDKNQMVYCINQLSQIVRLNTTNATSESLIFVQKGKNYGLRLSTDEKILYFVNSELGLCEFDLQSRRVSTLVQNYQGEFLTSLNSVEVNPQDPNILYITQSSTAMPLEMLKIDIIMNNPFGRVFQFNKKTSRLSLLADKMYFPNGVAFHKYEGQDTILVTQTSRLRVNRIFLSGERRGERQIVVDKMDVLPASIRSNEEGSFFIGSIGTRSLWARLFDNNPWARTILSRLHIIFMSSFVTTDQFGGAVLKFSPRTNSPKVRYRLWKSYPNYEYASTFLEKNNKLYVSSYDDEGVLVIDKSKQKLKKKKTQADETKKNKKCIQVDKSGDRFEKKPLF